LEKHTLRLDVVIVWAKDIAEGMLYLHEGAPCQVVHRDLKSLNVLVASAAEGTIPVLRICDFGTAREVHSSSMDLSTFAGTVAWMAPEMIHRKGAVTAKVDVYSYGVILWELLTQEVPFQGCNQANVMSAVPLLF
jgi:serine/threonine protein kinase